MVQFFPFDLAYSTKTVNVSNQQVCQLRKMLGLFITDVNGRVTGINFLTVKFNKVGHSGGVAVGALPNM